MQRVWFICIWRSLCFRVNGRGIIANRISRLQVEPTGLTSGPLYNGIRSEIFRRFNAALYYCSYRATFSSYKIKISARGFYFPIYFRLYYIPLLISFHIISSLHILFVISRYIYTLFIKRLPAAMCNKVKLFECKIISRWAALHWQRFGRKRCCTKKKTSNGLCNNSSPFVVVT